MSKLPFTLSVLALSIASAHAETDTQNEGVQEMETMVVTATRYTQTPDKIAGAVTVIDAEDIEEQSIISDDLTSILATLVPGITPSRQKMSNQGENLRGRQALIMIDGVPQVNPLRNGNRYGYTIDPSMVERIEVVNGASAVQGMGATGGIINYITKGAKPGDDWKQTVGTRVTSSFDNDSTGGKVFYNVSKYDDEFDLFFGGSWDQQGLYYDGNGNPIGMNDIQGETQDSTATDIFFKGGYNFDDGNQRIELTANTYTIEANGNYKGVKGDFENGIPGTVEPGSPSGEPVSNEAQLFNLQYTNYDLGNGMLTAQMFYQNYDAVFGEATWYPTETKVNDQGAISSQKTGFKVGYETYDLLDLDDTWVFGLDGLHDQTEQTLDQSGLNVTPLMEYYSLAPFVQGDFLVTDALRLSTGVRYESIRVKVSDGQTIYGYGVDGHNSEIIGGTQDSSKAVFNVGAVYTFTNEFSTFASFNQGFGLPDIGRILRGNWVGDANPGQNGTPIDFNTMPAVEPVVTDNYELGLTYRGDKLFVSASTYMSIAKDGANLALNNNGTYDVERQRTDIMGYELTSTYQVLDSTKLSAMYAHVEGEVDTTGNGSVDSDMDLKNLTPDRLLLAVNHNFSDVLESRIQYNYLFDSKKSANNVGAEQNFDGYGLVDFSTHYDMRDKGRIAFGIENVMDEQYINYFSQIRNHSSYYFSGRGRTFSLSYELDF
ncbi:COG1629 Outer membrane receptor proteins [Vibrio sp. B1FIG11]|uniref:TonB-dependent receptor n=1 Tax=Vibrio sp. B1FIG11 TaxID=2751177 RepID=UPI001AF591C8|nr:TonB-dependent receptor [Vibrio sp. B1FIG11]CAD7823189.1 COG1629 Outer membrane receptor proteins [Vibrio sp. B1FIG11]CAE6948935.1 COG1629 Outer membrane receptor proteins [Vibrio sp. B1FIG11]HDM8231248.1 TonB-dependent receptor [Vibrio campbellii]